MSSSTRSKSKSEKEEETPQEQGTEQILVRLLTREAMDQLLTNKLDAMEQHMVNVEQRLELSDKRSVKRKDSGGKTRSGS